MTRKTRKNQAVLRDYQWFVISGIGLLFANIGCSQPAGPKTAPVDGIVTLSNAPLSGARLMIVPEKGPVSLGITSIEGKFKISSVVVGPVKVAISVDEPEEVSDAFKDVSKPPKTDEEAQAYLKRAAELQKEMMDKSRSTKKAKPAPKLLPSKYGKTDTSGLSYTVKENGDNHFKIEL
jgi:hypothetical protein